MRAVKFLDTNELSKRYPKERNSTATQMVWKFVDEGYNVARIYQLGLSSASTPDFSQTIKNALEENLPKNAIIDIAHYMDITELTKDTIYVVFKTVNKK